MKEEQRIYMKKIEDMEVNLKIQKENLEKMKDIIRQDKIVLEMQEMIIKTIFKDSEKKSELLKDYEHNKELHKDMEEKYENAKTTVAANEMMLTVLKEVGQYDKLYEEFLDEAVEELLERDRNNVC